MIFRSFTSSAKDLDHVPRLVVLAFFLAGCAASIDLSRFLLLLVVIPHFPRLCLLVFFGNPISTLDPHILGWPGI